MGDANATKRFMVEPADIDDIVAFDPEAFEGMAEEFGEFPNALRIMGRDPELLRLMMVTNRYIFFRKGKVDTALRWLLAHVASRAAGCSYCTAHSAHWGNRFAGLSAEKAKAVWEFESSPLFNEAEKSAIRYAMAAGMVPNAVTREHFDDLHKYWTDDQIVEMTAAICQFGFFNRWNDTMSTPLEDAPREFANVNLRPSGWKDKADGTP